MRDKQSGVLCLRLTRGILHTNGGDGDHIRAHRPTVEAKGAFRRRASGERQVSQVGRAIRLDEGLIGGNNVLLVVGSLNQAIVANHRWQPRQVGGLLKT